MRPGNLEAMRRPPSRTARTATGADTNRDAATPKVAASLARRHWTSGPVVRTTAVSGPADQLAVGFRAWHVASAACGEMCPAERSAASRSASSPPTASPRATMPAVSESGICLSVMARIRAMAMNGTRYQNTGASESA